MSDGKLASAFLLEKPKVENDRGSELSALLPELAAMLRKRGCIGISFLINTITKKNPIEKINRSETYSETFSKISPTKNPHNSRCKGFCKIKTCCRGRVRTFTR